HTAHYTASNILRHSTFILVVRLPTNSTLFPYTPLFRSRKLWADVFPSARSLVAVGKFARYEARSACSRHRSSIDFIRDTAHRALDRKSTRLNSSHVKISYAVFLLKKKNKRLIIFV